MASELLAVETIEETEIDPTQPGVSWAAIAAGAVAAAALSLLLVAFSEPGLGFRLFHPGATAVFQLRPSASVPEFTYA
jgi:hypothetical protein